MNKFPNEWITLPIKNIFRISSGTFLQKEDTILDGEYNIYGGNGIIGKHDNYNLQGENIIIGRVGAKCGNVRLIKGKIWLTDNALYISNYLIDINKVYLKLFLDFIDLGKTANKAAQPVISYKSIKDIIVPLPPLSEQTRIVAKLDAIFSRIDKSIALLEENILLIEDFVKSALDNAFKNIPSYNYNSLFDIVNQNNRIIIPNENEYYNYVGLENISQNTGMLVDFLKTKGDSIKSSKITFSKGNILYGKLRPYLNKVWVAEFDGIATTEILPLNPKSDIIDSNFLALYLRSDTFVQLANSFTSGARMPRVTTTFLKKEAKVPVIPIKEQRIIATHLNELLDKAYKIKTEQQSKLNNLKLLKSSILNKAFKGEL